ncbi:MAG: glycosyltransferase family 39 protein [Planctomycetes bacterium]|nr:glycosyltransferase family 39 protein [Planctomycetota bacterium]
MSGPLPASSSPLPTSQAAGGAGAEARAATGAGRLASLAARAAPALAFALLALLYLQGIGAHGLTYPEESLKNEMAREMAVRGDWLVPRLNGEPRITKPPMVVWLTAASFRVFGVSEWAARFPSACFGLATLLAVYGLGRLLFDVRTALASALALALSVGPFLWSRSQAHDPALTCFVAWSWVGLAGCALGPAGAGGSGGRGGAVGWPALPWPALAWLAMTAGAMGKGLVALLPLLGYVLHAAATGSLREAACRLRLGPGLAAFFLLQLPWYAAIELREPGTLANLFWNEQVNRFLSAKTPLDYRSRPIGEFLGMYAAFLFPVCLLLPAAGAVAATGWRTWGAAERRGWLLPACWLSTVLAFFCVSSGRLVGYSYPAMPPAALLAGRLLTRALDEDAAPALRATIGWLLLGLGALALGGACVLPPVLAFYSVDMEPGVLETVRAWCCCGLAAGGLAGAAAWFAGKRPLALGVAAAGLAVLLVGVGKAHALASVRSTYRQAGLYLAARPVVDRAVVVIPRPKEVGVVGGLNFYARLRVRILLRPGESDFAHEVRRPAEVYVSPVELQVLGLRRRVYVVCRDPEELARLGACWAGGGRVLGPFGGFWILTQARGSGAWDVGRVWTRWF